MKFIYISDIFGVGQTIENFFYKVLILIDSFVYSLINWVYQIIMNLSRINLLTDTEVIDNLMNRIYIIVGVVVLFLVAYSLLKAMVNPDEGLKGKQSPTKIISNVVISIVLIALVPTIFDFAMGFQDAILTNNTLGKLVMGTDGTDDNATTISDGGFTMSIGVFQAFFHPSSSYCQYTMKDADGNLPCKEGTELSVEYNGQSMSYSDYWENHVKANKDFLMIQNLTDYVVEDKIDYTFLFSTIAGVLVLFVLLSYCIDLAVRTVKLAVFELIAPLPILCRIVPGDQGQKVFSNWLKATLSTYLEVFIRLIILYFAVLIIEIVAGNWTNIFTAAFSTGANPIISFLTLAFVVIGIILFVKQAPQLIKEITGLDGGKYGKSFIRGIGMMAGTLGGGVTAAIRSFANDKDKSLPNRFKRAATAGLGANARGLWEGSKAEKLSDAPKVAGKASSKTLSHRADIEAAGGYGKYWAQRKTDAVDTAKDWVGGTADSLKADKAVSDKLLKVVGEVKSTAEDYIGKHAHEYFAFGDNDVDQNGTKLSVVYENLMAQAKLAKQSGNQQAIAKAEVDIEAFKQQHADKRLDVLKAAMETAQNGTDPIAKAEAERVYQSALKKTTDDFATTVHTHYGAEKEAAIVTESMKTMTQLVKEGGSSTAVQYFTKGSVEHGLAANTSQLTEATAGKYFKDIKAAAEYANADNKAKLAENERREERRKNNNGGDKK